jgi:predicted nucleic acid-binding protein
VDLFEAPTTTFIDMAQAGDRAKAFNLQYFDALIIAISTRAGATMLLSEDGLDVDGIKVVNPFIAANETVLANYIALVFYTNGPMS